MRIMYTADALRDLEGVLLYIAARNSTASIRAAARVRMAISHIALFPNASRLDRETGVREYVVSDLPILVTYQVYDNHVKIVAIFHTAQDLSSKRRGMPGT